MLTPTLETERIILRPLMMADADAIYTNWASDPLVTKFTLWNTHESVGVTKEWLAVSEPGIDSDKEYNWGMVLKETGELFGSGGFHYLESKKMFELGYVIRHNLWNKGLTTEATRAMVDFAFDKLGVTILFARHAKENIYSGKVMEKLGFVYQNDCEIVSFDGKRTYEGREYLLSLNQLEQ